MDYLVVAAWDADNKITGYNSTSDEAIAIAMRDSMIAEEYTGAFYVEKPLGSRPYWTVDPKNKTVTYDPAEKAAALKAAKWGHIRVKRDQLLEESDWTQYNDSPLTDEAKAEWAVHRQSLRDLPHTTDDPADPTWPTPPG